MDDGRDVERSERRLWPWVLGGIGGAFLLTCAGIVAWAALDGGEPASPVAVQPAPTVPDDDGPLIEIGDGESEVGVPRRLFTRTLDDGTEVRANVTVNMSEDDIAGMDRGGRPLWCTNRGWVDAVAITPDTIVSTGVALQAAAVPRGMTQVSTMTSGNDLVVAAVVAGPEDAALVRMAVPGGRVDQMEPVEGIGVLVVIVPGGAQNNGGGVLERGVQIEGIVAPDGGFIVPGAGIDATVQIVLADGGTIDVPQSGTPERPWWGAEESPECGGGGGGVFVPPPTTAAPTLPPPSTEQPEDPIAARDEIETNFGLLYSLTPEEDDLRFSLIDDPTGLSDALDEVRNGSIIETIDGAIVVTVTDLVFTSPTEAQFVYTLTAGTFEFAGNFGRARLIDGVWKITRSTYCQDLARGGGICGV